MERRYFFREGVENVSIFLNTGYRLCSQAEACF